MRYLLAAAVLGVVAYVGYRRFLMPWDRREVLTTAKQMQDFIKSPDEAAMPPRTHKRTYSGQWWKLAVDQFDSQKARKRA